MIGGMGEREFGAVGGRVAHRCGHGRRIGERAQKGVLSYEVLPGPLDPQFCVIGKVGSKEGDLKVALAAQLLRLDRRRVRVQVHLTLQLLLVDRSERLYNLPMQPRTDKQRHGTI